MLSSLKKNPILTGRFKSIADITILLLLMNMMSRSSDVYDDNELSNFF